MSRINPVACGGRDRSGATAPACAWPRELPSPWSSCIRRSTHFAAMEQPALFVHDLCEYAHALPK